MRRGSPQVSVLVPTLNEVENVDLLLEQLTKAFADEPYAVEILVADGGSKDGTHERVEAWGQDHPVRLIRCASGRGLAGDVVEAARAAHGEVVVVVDADLSHPPQVAPKLARLVLDDQADVAIGSRYVAGGSTPGWPLLRRLYSRSASLLARPFVDARDPLSGFFALRRERLIESGEGADGFKIGLEVLLRGEDGLRVAELGIEFRDRQRGQSKLGFSEAFAYLSRIARLFGSDPSRRAPIRLEVFVLIGLALDFLASVSLLELGASPLEAHLGGFLCAAAAWLAGSSWKLRDHPAATRKSTLGRFTIVALLALTLRGGLLGNALRAGARPELGLLLDALAAAGVFWVGSFLYVREPVGPGLAPPPHWRVLAVALCAYLLILRLVYLGLPNLLVEEAYYWNYGKHPALSYLDHPPMVAVLIRLGTALFGDSEFGVRTPAFLCTLASIVFGYRLACNLFDRSTAIRAAVLLCGLPLFFILGFFMTPDSPLIASWAGTLYFLERALLGGKARAWYGAGLCLGLGLLSKYTIILLAPATLLFLVLHRPSRTWLARKEPYLAFALAVALFSPVLIWNAQNEWASFVFQGPRRFQASHGVGLPRLVASILLVLSPPVALAAAVSLVERVRPTGSSAEQVRRGAVRTFSLVFTFVPVAVFALFSLRHSDVKLNWTGPAWLALVPLLAAQWTALPRADWSPWRTKIVSSFPATIAVLAAIYGLGLHYHALGFPGIGYPKRTQVFGWESLGTQVERIEDAIEKRDGQEPLVMGLDKYNITSALAFYRTRANRHSDEAHARTEAVAGTVGRHLIGKQALMYRYWSDEAQSRGRTVVMVAEDADVLASAEVENKFTHLSEIETLNTTHNGKASGQYHLRIGYDFQPKAGPIEATP